MSLLLDNLLIFSRLLRRAGVEVQGNAVAALVDALRYVDLAVRDDVYHACRALLVHRHDQIAVFDLAFAAFWRQHQGGRPRTAAGATPAAEPPAAGVRIEDLLASHDEADADAAAPGGSAKIWSTSGALAGKDFAAFTADELAEARAALSRLAWQPGQRRTRRWTRGRGARVDLRRAIAGSLRTGGEVVKLPRRARQVRPRPLVLLCDVSGSMERYSRMLLHFAHAVTQRHRRVETFLFSTTLTRVTRELRAAGPDEALAAVSRSAADFSGGTRIGAVLKEFHQRWGRRVLHGGPVALLISDGWDLGDPLELADQTARLQRSCHRLIWLNPLIGTADYAPLTRGLQAALPFVDDFLPVRTLTNLAQLALHLNALA
ncbi:MAG: domain containing CoxE-like protein [Acidobacteria bacterium]|nr:domain containing CoxE-like protein [Acidobacteriota bacterium]